jgi:hypothetical protein
MLGMPFKLNTRILVTSPLNPLSSQCFRNKSEYFMAGEGSERREGAKPPLKILSPLKQEWQIIYDETV